MNKPKLTFAAIDFETANYRRDSACAVGVVRVERGRIVQRVSARIRPPERWFTFTDIHGIRWADVADAPTFGELWPELEPLFAGVAFLAAHNAPFDRSVLRASCERYGIAAPEIPFLCTVRIARSVWNLRPTTLRHVADHLRLPLVHHDPRSDAEACARIVLRAAA
jgi:DNA polymerase-3 subunit epsilon